MDELFKSIFEPMPSDIINSFTTKTTRYERILKKGRSDKSRDREISKFSVELSLGDDAEIRKEDV